MMVKVVAQKVNADGRVFLLREIYGIERKTHKTDEHASPESPSSGSKAELSAAEDDEDDESERECVVSVALLMGLRPTQRSAHMLPCLPFFLIMQVCMSEPMDTMVLPCRHLCLCNSCAEVLRYQASKCPICRAPFHSLLKISVAKREEDLTPDQLEATAVRWTCLCGSEAKPTFFHCCTFSSRRLFCRTKKLPLRPATGWCLWLKRCDHRETMAI